jgi:hypothetical protein
MTETKRSRGRPVTGEAMTPTERVKVADAALVSERYGSDRAAIEVALIVLNIVAPHDK